MLVSLERNGQFRAVSMIPNPCKCAAMRTRNYKYFVRINATDTHLTKEGFVMNNETIQVYFDNRFGKLAKPWDAVSCERMAITAAKELCNLLLQQNVSLENVIVRIKGSNGAWIEALCQRGDVNNAENG